MPVAKSPEFRRRALELADHREPVRRTWPDRVPRFRWGWSQAAIWIVAPATRKASRCTDRGRWSTG